LRHKLRRRQEELLRREAEQNEKKLMQLKNEQLEQELEQKNRELANVATNIVYKNELLNKLQEELFNVRSEEHTSELQSRENLVCRLLLEKKKKYIREH